MFFRGGSIIKWYSNKRNFINTEIARSYESNMKRSFVVTESVKFFFLLSRLMLTGLVVFTVDQVSQQRKQKELELSGIQEKTNRQWMSNQKCVTRIFKI